MSARPQRDFAVLRGAVGATLLGLARDRYLFNGQPSLVGGDGCLEMRFDGDRVVTLYLASDGESVRAAATELEIPQPFELDGGETCAWEREDLGRSPEFGPLIGRAVTFVEAVIETWSNPPGVEVVRGWVVRFTGGDFVSYQNFGDSSRILLNELLNRPDPMIHTRVETIEAS